MEVKEYTKKVKNTKPKAEVEELIKKMKKEDDKLVKGQFEFVDAQGGFFEFGYKVYPGEPYQVYKLVHGEICTIPMGVVKHLNGTKKKIRRYDNVELKNGVQKPLRTYETTSRVRFVPVDYL
jgi:hypothetical protein